MCSNQKVRLEFLQNVIFSRKKEKFGKNRNLISTYPWTMFIYTQCPNYSWKYRFLKKLCLFPVSPTYKDIDQNLPRSHWVAFRKKLEILKQYSQSLKILPLYASYDALKSHKLLILFKKISMCEVETAAGGAKLHPPTGQP